MPLDLESSKTLGELMLDLAREVGLVYYGTDGMMLGALPEDEEHLARLRDTINEGYKLFLRSDPHWTFCQEPVDLTLSPEGTGPFNIAGDPGRYRLPHPIRSRPRSGWVFLDENSSYARIQERPIHLLETWRHQHVTTGTPQYAACRRLPAQDADGDRSADGDWGGGCWEVVFWPSPDAAYRLRATFRIVPYDLVSQAERHIAGADHDHAVLTAAIHRWRQRDGEDSEKQHAAAEWVMALAASRQLDRADRPVNFGTLRDPGLDRGERLSRRASGLVTLHNGIPIP